MPYHSGRPQRIYGVDYAIGDLVPAGVVNGLKQNVVNNLITRGFLVYREESEQPSVEPAPQPQPVYKGSGWWEFDNGMKIRGKADEPPVLTGVS